MTQQRLVMELLDVGLTYRSATPCSGARSSLRWSTSTSRFTQARRWV